MLLNLISKLVLLEKEYIVSIADTASWRYKRFFINKKNGKLRAIYHPAKELKAIQRVVHDEVLKKLPSHEASYAYKQGCSVKKHAEMHKGARYMLRIDFKNFFESIRTEDIRHFADKKMMSYVEGWTNADTELLVKLTSFQEGLTIGSITSPLLSDAICYDLDVAVFSLAHELGVKYTRYADDLYFSTNKKGVLKSIPPKIDALLLDLKCPHNLKINTAKTHHSSKKSRMMVTGLTITNDNNISIGRTRKREIRSQIYKWTNLNDEDKKYLSGYLSYIKSVEPEFINALCCKYGSSKIKEIIVFNSSGTN
ncbi:retron St85 family RNA-directed DNA polymerase [Vibrio vulnificus]|nr:retron St85 family RNA-directed DNA polymerase [Vibrio vulnificus]EJE8543008.1 retron St85 family RNA-directed DNA polymerase [Vibrio vulnificus]ELX4188682.1 retron St85 family RNA-directed DNA polymerase [Vibrio vulnificus]